MTVSRPAAVIVLAAGAGTRMRSAQPKVLHAICGRSMLDHVLTAAREVEPAALVVVVGHQRDQLTSHLAEYAPEAHVVVQEPRGGTGHAVRMVTESVSLGSGTVVVMLGDTPVLRGETLATLVRTHVAAGAAATVLTAAMADPAGYGRIVRDASGGVAGIVEEADASPAERGITEVNSGVFAFDSALLASAVKRLQASNTKGEEYLTDVVAILRGDGHPVASFLAPDSDEVRGVNDLVQLAEARRVLTWRLLAEWMRTGVTVTDPYTTAIDVGVVLEPDAEIGPGTQLLGATVVEAEARVGPGCVLRDTRVGRGAAVAHAVCESAVIGPGAIVGPFTYLPPGTQIPPGTQWPSTTGGTPK